MLHTWMSIVLLFAACKDRTSPGAVSHADPTAASQPATSDAEAEGAANQPPTGSEDENPELKPRPAWVTDAAKPGAGFCEDESTRLRCVGVSAYVPKRVLAWNQARQAAEGAMVEALVAEAKIGDGKRAIARNALAAALGADGEPELRAGELDRYWEEYAKIDAEGTEFLGYLNLALMPDARRKLVEHARAAAR